MHVIVLLLFSIPIIAMQISCGDAEQILNQKLLNYVESRHSTLSFNNLKVESMGTTVPSTCDYVAFEWPDKISLASDIIIKADAYKNGVFQKRITKIFRVSGTANVMALKQRVQKGDAFSRSSTEVRAIDVSALTPHSISFIKEGYQFKRYMDAGEIVEAWMIEKSPDVVKGASVKAVVQRHSITLTLNAKILQNGSVGENVRLQLDESNMILLGTLHDKKTVIISSL